MRVPETNQMLTMKAKIKNSLQARKIEQRKPHVLDNIAGIFLLSELKCRKEMKFKASI